MGCEEDGDVLYSDLPGVGEVRRCPITFITPEVREVLSLWPLWDKGVMPCAGGVLDQASTCIDALQELDSMVNKWNKKKAEEAAERARRGNR